MPENDLDRTLDTETALLYVSADIEAAVSLGLIDSVLKMSVVRQARALLSLCGTGTKAELSAATDRFMEMISDCDRAAQESVRVARAEAAALCARVAQLETERAAPPISLAAIDDELARRATARKRLAELQEELENERDQLIEEADRLQHQPGKAAKAALAERQQRIASLRDTIEGVVQGLANNDREVRMMHNYRQAIALVATGIPSGVIGRKFDMPTAKLRVAK